MKQNLLAVALLILANAVLGLLGCSKTSEGTETTADSDRIACHSGGPGHKTCEIAAGIAIDGGITTSCSVTCEDGYYACCGLECRCYPEK